MLKWLAGLAAFALALVVAVLVQAQFGDPDAVEIEKEDFFREGLAPVRKDAGYNLTIVYFMDYQCPACRRFTPDVAKVFGEDRKLRVIYRDTPIFGPRSEVAARAAIASQFQGKHEAFHHALMTTKLPLDEEALQAAARKAGVDWERLQSDMEKRREDIDRQIATNTALSGAAGISGTPAFIIGEGLVDGALDYKGLRSEIAEARKELGIAASQPSEASKPPVSETEPQESESPATVDKSPVFERTATASATDETADESTDAPAPHTVWLAILGALFAFALGWLVVRRRSKGAA